MTLKVAAFTAVFVGGAVVMTAGCVAWSIIDVTRNGITEEVRKYRKAQRRRR